MIDSIRCLWPYHKHGILLIQWKSVANYSSGAWRDLCNSEQNRANCVMFFIPAPTPDWPEWSAPFRNAGHDDLFQPTEVY